jgi:curli production assembly/transport component CsgG
MRKSALIIGLFASLVAGCTGRLAERAAKPSEGVLPPIVGPMTRMNEKLRNLPPPQQKVAIAVYGYTDQTGQFKQGENFQQLSRAVTQGATSVLIKALQDAGSGSWFTVVEREKLDNLLKERRIIADMRNLYLGERNVNPKALPPLLFAGVLLEGGIIGYDSNTRTGGAGARYLGIGGDLQYREDTVTMYLRAISTKTGEVMVSVVSHKTILSVALRGSAFKFVALDKILEAEAGFSNNEPDQIAVQQAIEKAVQALIIDGSARGIWGFHDKAYQREAIERYDQEQQVEQAQVARMAALQAKANKEIAEAKAAEASKAVAANGNTPAPQPQGAPVAPASVARAPAPATAQNANQQSRQRAGSAQGAPPRAAVTAEESSVRVANQQ